MGTTPPITTNNPQNTRSTKPDQTINQVAPVNNAAGHQPERPQQRRKVTLSATRFIHPHSWSHPPKTALHIVGCGGGGRSVPGVVDSIVGRRPNTGVHLGRLINQNSHAIRVPELSAAPENVAIPTVRFQRLTYVWGGVFNCLCIRLLFERIDA